MTKTLKFENIESVKEILNYFGYTHVDYKTVDGFSYVSPPVPRGHVRHVNLEYYTPQKVFQVTTTSNMLSVEDAEIYSQQLTQVIVHAKVLNALLEQ